MTTPDTIRGDVPPSDLGDRIRHALDDPGEFKAAMLDLARDFDL